MRQLQIVDMFCGGGGESTGLIQAAASHGFSVRLSAINHWERAIETHAANHPGAEHFCESVERLDPAKVVPSGRLDLLWASPECTHHSRARGGRPRSDQSRASAWEILKWAGDLDIERIIIENVPEFQTWGRLDADGKPIKSERGRIFRSFIAALRTHGYAVDYRVLCAADYGAPTTRRRLFIQAAKGRKKIIWPECTNMEDEDNLFRLPKWRSAEEIVDWLLPSQPISARKKPLAAATMRRIEHGMRKYWGKSAVPFLAVLRGTGTARSLDRPLPSVTCSGAHHALVQPEPYLVRYNGGDCRTHSIAAPMPTLDTRNRYGMVQPQGMADVCFRMLQPHELAAATGFPAGYKITGTKAEQVRQIGNAVPPAFASALLSEILKDKGAAP